MEDAAAKVDGKFTTPTSATRAVKGLKGAVGIIKLPAKIAKAFNINLTDYVTDWLGDLEQLRREGLANHAFKLDDLSSLKHNRMFFPTAAEELTFQYHVAEAAPHNHLSRAVVRRIRRRDFY